MCSGVESRICEQGGHNRQRVALARWLPPRAKETALTHHATQNHTPPSTSVAEQAIACLVEQLIAAENDQRPKLMASLLSPRFVGMTRADGLEQTREEFVNQLGTSRPVAARRKLEQPPEIHAAKTLAAARLVTTVAASDRAASVQRSRDTLLFEHVGDGWRCLSWQSTTLM